jgi:hypothetical protein
MRPWKQFTLVAGLSASCLSALGQDSQSLGDAGRQARQQKQSKGTPTKSGTASAIPTFKIITNDDIAGSSDAAGDASAGGKNYGSAGTAQSSSSSSSKRCRARRGSRRFRDRSKRLTLCRPISTSSTTRFISRPAIAFLGACSGTSASSKSSRKWSGCAHSLSNRNSSCMTCRNRPASRAMAARFTIRRAGCESPIS